MDIQAIYLNKKRADSATIEDESGNGNNATLVQAQCAKGDGTAYAKGNTDNIHNGTNVDFRLIIAPSFTSSYETILSKYDSTDGEFFFYTYNNDGTYNNVLFFFYKDNSGTSHQFYLLKNATADTWYDIEGNFDNGTITWTVNGGAEQTDSSSVTEIRSTTGDELELFSRLLGSTQFYTGKASFLKFGNAEFNLAEGGLSDILYNTGTAGGNAVLQGATLSDFWSEKQDVYHYNFLNGFDLWENGTAGEEIRVPIGKNVTTSGYSYSETYQAGKWHNDAETKIQLPLSLKTVADGDITNPLNYDNFELDFNNAHTGFSNREDKKHKYLLFYNRALTTAEQKKIQKCLKWKNSDNLLTDEDGNLLTDENGLYLEE